MKITRAPRKFLSEDLTIDSWNKIEPYIEDLVSRDIESKEDFSQWLEDQSELESVLEEDMAWRYIKMSIDTKDEQLASSYNFFVNEIQPKLAPFEDRLNKKLVELPFLKDFENDQAYTILFRKIQTAIELYRAKNIDIQAAISEESQKYGAISAKQTIDHDGKTLTMQQASLYLKQIDENVRKEVYSKMAKRRIEDKDELDSLFNSLLKKRHSIAINAGFKNYRGYKLKSMGRFDYTTQDCFNFHASIKSEIVPIVKVIQKEKLNKLGKNMFKPWDLDVDPESKPPLKPFSKGDELLIGTIKMFNSLDPYFGDCLKTMEDMGHLDLESKQGKSPGGYNYPLYEIGVPFIFMNAVGSQRDLVTMVHEGGHAIHSFLSRDLKLTGFKNLPSEVAELASMSMELLSMSKWGEFYPEEDELRRAKKDQLETIIKILPWIAQIDEFQHWLYENYEHSTEDRTSKWTELCQEYGTDLVDWDEFEFMKNTSWQRQLHIFEVPFYYIEYGIAQLGALQIWKNFLSNEETTLSNYKNALQLAYTKSIPEIYATAGIPFDFSQETIKDLAQFVLAELKKL